MVRNGLDAGLVVLFILLSVTPGITGNVSTSRDVTIDAAFNSITSFDGPEEERTKSSNGLDSYSLQNDTRSKVCAVEYGSLYQKVTDSGQNITFTKHVIDTHLDYVFGVFACDIDNDDDCDILGAAEEGDEIVLYRNDGGIPINWTRVVIDDAFDGATNIFATDIDGDFDIDVVGSAWHANEIAWWRNDGGNPILWHKYTIRTEFAFAHEVYCHDLDNDGDMDILGASSEDHQIAWWRNNGGNPVRWTEQIIGDNFWGAKSVRVTDVDNDGLLDVLGAAILADKICWWKNNGGEPIEWEEHVIDDNFDGAHRVEVCDMDFDGDIDVVGAAYFDREISWWKNEGGVPIIWTKQVVTTGFNGACIGLPVDIDEDGDIDIVGTAQQAHDVAYFRNDGGNPIGWTKLIIDSFFQGAWPGFVCDIDGDGDSDIVAGASWEDKLAWWESDLHQQPLKPTRPTGTTSGRAVVEYTYTTVTNDPEGSQLFYLFDWGDSSTSGWLGPFPSGHEANATHSWNQTGNFEIRAKAKNIHGSESDWSDPLPVSMPLRHQTLLERIIEWILQLFEITIP